MADNFLEKRMEDFRNGKMSVAGKKRDTSNDPVVFISGGCSDKGKAAVKDYRSRNYRVAFCDTDRKAGNLLAQVSGSRFYPVDSFCGEVLDRCRKGIISHWGRIDEEINLH